MSKFNYSSESLVSLYHNLNMSLKWNGAKSDIFLVPTLQGDDVFILRFPEDENIIGILQKRDGVWSVNIMDKMFNLHLKTHGVGVGYVFSQLKEKVV